MTGRNVLIVLMIVVGGYVLIVGPRMRECEAAGGVFLTREWVCIRSSEVIR